MADKTIGSLPQAAAVGDDSLFVMEQQGKAMKISGAQMLSFANVETEAQVQAAAESAAAAAAAESAASASAASAAGSASDAQTAATTYPRIGENGNWEVWNPQTGEYQDTGVAATGPTGPTGPAGGVDSFNGRTGAVMPQSGDYTAAQVGAAPGGYGLGGMSTLLTSADDLNNLYQCGWYKFTSENMPQNAVAASYLNLLCVYGASNSAFVQTVYGITNNASYKWAPIARRFIYGSVSIPWEYFNPTLVLGVEYRTIERYGSNPVYTQLVNFGTLPAASAKNVSVLPSGCNIFEVKGICSNGVTLPGMITGTSQQPIFMYGYRNSIVVSTSADYGPVTATAVVKYTKTSD